MSDDSWSWHTQGSVSAWHRISEELLAKKRIMPFQIGWEVALGDAVEPSPRERSILNELMNPVLPHYREGWCEWNIKVIFPQKKYIGPYNGDLWAMAMDARWEDQPHRGSKEGSVFSRLCNPRPDWAQGYMTWMLERMSDRRLRYQPFYHFDVVNMSAILFPFEDNRRLVQHAALNSACTTQVSFMITGEGPVKTLRLTAQMRNALWSHLYGDVFGFSYMARAVADALEPGVQAIQVAIQSPSAKSDRPKQLRAYIKQMEKLR